MKTYLLNSLLGLLAVVLIGTSCTQPAATVDVEAEKQAIDSLVHSTVNAVYAKDWDSFKANFTDDLQLYGMGQVMTADEQIQWFKDNVGDHSGSISINEIMLSDDGSLAVVKAKEETAMKIQGKGVTQEALFTVVCENMDGTWKMAHVQRSFNCPPPPSQAEMKEGEATMDDTADDM